MGGRFSSSLIFIECAELREPASPLLQKQRQNNGSLDVFSFQAGKILKNFLSGIAVSQAREHGAQGDARPLEHRLPTADSLVTNDAVWVVFQIVGSPAHGDCLKL